VEKQPDRDATLRREILRDFLVDRRSRLRAEDVGLHTYGRSSDGLSQADVAELAGFSLNWYELFESGRDDRHVSVDFVERIANALRLDADDRLELFRLAASTSEGLRYSRLHAEDEAIAALRAMPDLVRNIVTATDLHETVRLSADAMQTAIAPDLATVVTIRENENLRGVAAGPRASSVSDAVHRAFWDAYSDLPRGHVAIEESDEESLGILGARSWMTVAARRGEALTALLGVFSSAPRTFSRVEQEMSLAVAAIDEIIFSKFESS